MQTKLKPRKYHLATCGTGLTVDYLCGRSEFHYPEGPIDFGDKRNKRKGVCKTCLKIANNSEGGD